MVNPDKRNPIFRVENKNGLGFYQNDKIKTNTIISLALELGIDHNDSDLYPASIDEDYMLNKNEYFACPNACAFINWFHDCLEKIWEKGTILIIHSETSTVLKSQKQCTFMWQNAMVIDVLNR